MSMILQTPRLTNLSSSARSDELNLLFRISRLSLQTPNFPATKTAPIQMRKGPRNYPGGLNKYQWRRVKPLKAKKIREAGVRREPRVYQMRKRAELRSAVLELERPWESFGGRDDQPQKQGKSYSKRSVLGWNSYGSINDSGNSSRPSCSFGERGNGWESESETDDDDDEFGNLRFNGGEEKGDDEEWMSNRLSKRSVLGGESYWSITISGSSNVGKDCRELDRAGCLFGERSNGSESEREIEGELESSLIDNPVMESSYWQKSRISGEEERIGNVREVENAEKKGGFPRGRLGNKGEMDSGKALWNKEEICGIASGRRGRCRTNIRGQDQGRVSRKMKFSHSGEVLNFKWDGTYDKSRTNHQ